MSPLPSALTAAPSPVSQAESTTTCEVLELPLDAERRALLQTLDAAGFETLLHTLRTERRWP